MPCALGNARGALPDERTFPDISVTSPLAVCGVSGEAQCARPAESPLLNGPEMSFPGILALNGTRSFQVHRYVMLQSMSGSAVLKVPLPFGLPVVSTLPVYSPLTPLLSLHGSKTTRPATRSAAR